MAHDSFDHLQAIILGALQICHNPSEGNENRITEMTAAFQQLKDDELDSIKWKELKDFLNSLDCSFY